MIILIKITQFILSLGILILLHEWGHYITARMFKTRVEKFYLFFDFLFPLPGVLNFSLFKKKIGDTEYGLGWFPMGGYVQIAGMVDESMDVEQMKQPAQPWEFRSKPAWQRLIIMLGGIIVNTLLAFLIYGMVLFVWGEQRLPMKSLKDGIFADSLAMKMGIQTGDKIVAINKEPLVYYNDMMARLITANTLTVERNGSTHEIALPVNFIDQLGSQKDLSFIHLRTPAVFNEYAENSLNFESKLMQNDRVIAINDSIPVFYTDEFRTQLQQFKNQKITVRFLRGKDSLTTPLKISSEGKAEIMIGNASLADLEKSGHLKFERYKYGFFESLPAGVKKTGEKLSFYIGQFKLIFSPSTGAYKHMGGFMSMAKALPSEWDWEYFWNYTAMLSIILAFMNLLPIPALDGGHAVFALWEIITRRKPSIKVLTYSQYVGMALLLALMLYANGNDIFKHFFK